MAGDPKQQRQHATIINETIKQEHMCISVEVIQNYSESMIEFLPAYPVLTQVSASTSLRAFKIDAEDSFTP